MCRWFVYIGEKECLYNLLYKPEHNLLKQCYSQVYSPSETQENNRNCAINVDGFGIAIYNPEEGGNPLIYKTTEHCWSDKNLLNLSKYLKTKLCMGHIRGIKPFQKYMEISYDNCHPFVYKNYSFCHNGDIKNFKLIKKPLRNIISKNLLKNLKGDTDSEYLFYLFIHYLIEGNDNDDNHDNNYDLTNLNEVILLEILLKSVRKIIELSNGSVSSFNLCLCDGKKIIVIRYINSNEEDPPSLYINEDYKTISNVQFIGEIVGKNLVISSEPLDKNSNWKLIPKNNYVIVNNSSLKFGEI